MTRSLCFRALALTALTVPAVALMALPAYGAADAPNGNNGTIKIDGVAMDEGNENNPHPGCSFVVDFFGYDVGTRTATLEFEGQAPTGGGMLLTDTFTFEVASRESGNELNHSRPVDLTDELAGIEPHPQQGWHVKLTAHVEGAQGADVKHKVFWIEECEGAAAAPDAEVVEDAEVVPAAPDEVTPAVASAPVVDVTDQVAVEAANVEAWNAAVWSNAMAAGASSQPEAAVLSATASAPAGAAAASAPAGALPRTGAMTEALLGFAFVALAVGGTLVVASRRNEANV